MPSEHGLKLVCLAFTANILLTDSPPTMARIFNLMKPIRED